MRGHGPVAPPRIATVLDQDRRKNDAFTSLCISARDVGEAILESLPLPPLTLPPLDDVIFD